MYDNQRADVSAEPQAQPPADVFEHSACEAYVAELGAQLRGRHGRHRDQGPLGRALDALVIGVAVDAWGAGHAVGWEEGYSDGGQDARGYLKDMRRILRALSGEEVDTTRLLFHLEAQGITIEPPYAAEEGGR